MWRLSKPTKHRTSSFQRFQFMECNSSSKLQASPSRSRNAGFAAGRSCLLLTISWRQIMTAHSYHNLENNPSSSIQSPLSCLKGFFALAFQALFDLLVVDSNAEPKITQLQGRDGEVFWEIYDARTGKTVYCMTEFEVMEWLDTRFYRQ